MWFHKTGRFAVGDNGEPSIYTACAVHREHIKLINCVNNMQDTRRQIRQLFFMSTQCKALNNLMAKAIHGHCCLRGPVRKSCNTQFRLCSPSARPQIAIISLASSGDKTNCLYNWSGQSRTLNMSVCCMFRLIFVNKSMLTTDITLLPTSAFRIFANLTKKLWVLHYI